MSLYYQCRMTQDAGDGLAVTQAWVEERGAQVGVRVELKGEDGLWLVESVGRPGIDKEEYLKRIRKGRTKFASLSKVG